ncbi:MAG: hydrogenase formation protein HypD [Armatimonadota bacterium]|nr:MAG: hydrogenase formation protein HypD [Armatimonadota bacterium]
MRPPGELRDPELLRRLAKQLKGMAAPPATLMEVCGTHTVAIARHGLREALPAGVSLISGPGCPVCVTPQDQVDLFIALGEQEGVRLATFGDMVRVPGTETSLEQARAEGAEILVVYSPMDAVEAAGREPERDVVFFGIGFETTAPAVALAILEARRRGLRNFSVLCAHKLIPPAMMALLESEVAIDGFICPGHVSAIIGSEAYRPVAERGKPCVVTGFEPADVLGGVRMLLRQIAEGRSEVEVEYRRAVRREGNVKAQEMLGEVFRVTDARWRGLGTIPASGYELAKEFGEFDAARRFEIEVPEGAEPAGCRCGDVLRGAIEPRECPLFGKACTPRTPVGACMVSSEGACQAYFRYRTGEDAE